MISGIYCITNTKNGKKYVGQSTNIKQRLIQHKSSLRHNKHYRHQHLQNAWNKYGEDSFIFEILEYCNIDELDDIEKYYIKIWDLTNPKYGYNKESGGHLNKTLNQETRKKISQSKKNQEPWNKGKTNIYSQETLDKMSRKAKGKSLSEEHKNKISTALSGKNNPMYGRKREANPTFKSEPRIVKGGFKNGKQNYVLKYDTKVFKQSVDYVKLEKELSKLKEDIKNNKV